MKKFKLENEPKIKTGFKTPENFFDTFSGKVMQQLPKEESKTISIFTKRKYLSYAVAAILILALTIPIYNHFYSPTIEIDDTTLENYIAYQSSISDTDLVNLLEEKDIQKLSVDLNLEDKTIENELSDNKNLEYLLLN